MWLFALMAHDGLSGVPGIVWGIPLAAAALYLVLYTAYACYEDYHEIQRQLADGAADDSNSCDGAADDSNSCIARAFVRVRRFCCCRAADDDAPDPVLLSSAEVVHAMAVSGLRDPKSVHANCVFDVCQALSRAIAVAIAKRKYVDRALAQRSQRWFGLEYAVTGAGRHSPALLSECTRDSPNT